MVSGHSPCDSATARQARRRRFRLHHLRVRGLTLIEVLMAMFVLAIGLFGVASLLPLGQKKVLEGMIDQRKAQTAEGAFQYLAAQGGLNPTRWVTYAGVNYDAVKASTGARILCRIAPGSTPSASAFSTDAAGLLNVDNAYKDCALEFRTGKLRGQRRLIAGYVGATKTFQFDTTGTLGVAYNQFPGAPYVGDVLTNDVNSNGR
ncbi:MAG: prepilin-type N-terminal cleavage/methylation domain-containing protein, partial [Planctomycetia bacterium]|nr:prepilin-type N-terminal cleavage/methylation domain-containing protein [Planctomycetia bacterium]